MLKNVQAHVFVGYLKRKRYKRNYVQFLQRPWF